MESEKVQRIKAVIVLVLLLGGGVAFGVFQFFIKAGPEGPLREVGGTVPRVMGARGTTVIRTVATGAPADWREKFMASYSLADGQVMKRIPPPFIPERAWYYKVEDTAQAQAMPEGPSYWVFNWMNNNTLMSANRGFGAARRRPADMIRSIMQFTQFDYEIPAEAAAVELPGDWIVRQSAGEQQKLDALAGIISDAAGKQYQFVQETRPRDVVIVSGTFAFKPQAGAPDTTTLQLFVDRYDPPGQESGNGAMSPQRLMTQLGSLIGMQIISESPEAEGASIAIAYRYHRSAFPSQVPPGPARDAIVKKLLENLTAQTGLKFTIENRSIKVWALKAK